MWRTEVDQFRRQAESPHAESLGECRYGVSCHRSLAHLTGLGQRPDHSTMSRVFGPSHGERG